MQAAQEQQEYDKWRENEFGSPTGQLTVADVGEIIDEKTADGSAEAALEQKAGAENSAKFFS